MESPNKNKHFPLLGLAALLLLFITMAPVAAQAPVQIALLSVTVSDTGNVSWNSVPGISRYALGYFVGCRGPRVEWGASGINQFQVPDYDPALHLYFWIEAFGEIDGRERLIGQGNVSNDGSCWIPPEPETQPEPGNTSTIQNIAVRFSLDVTRGEVAWRFIPSVYLYQFSYSRCGGPWVLGGIRSVLGGEGRGTRQYVPDYDPNVRYDFRVRGFTEQNGQYTVVGEGFGNNGRECGTSPPPQPAAPAPSGPVIAPISVLLNHQNGQVTWGPLNDTTNDTTTSFVVYYAACRASRVTWPAGISRSFQIPDYQSNVRYDVRVDAFEGGKDLAGYGVASNNITCDSPNTPDPIYEAPPSNAPGTITLTERNGTVARHIGSSLVVHTSSGTINARDNTRGASLSAPGNCVAGQTIASSDSLVISCTADGLFKVLQVHPQHPQDGRRDILVFNSSITYCYRAYEYLETGAIEVFYSQCDHD